MKKIIFFLVAGVLFATTSCKKFLDAKSDAGLVIPRSLDDLQRMLDHNSLMNSMAGSTGESCADNYYLTYSDWSGLADHYRNQYTWGEEMFYDQFQNEWSAAYTVISRANTILEYLDKFSNTITEQDYKNNIRGSALLYRGKAFYHLLQAFALAYDPATAATDMGIPIRLSSDFNIPSVRASVQASYQQVLKDLSEALPLLPAVPLHKMRPSKPAAYGLLARTFLAMGKFDKALSYADSALQVNHVLMNFNNSTDIAPSASFPFKLFNEEVIFHTATSSPSTLSQSKAKIDTVLYASYADNDLRKTLFFKTNSDGSRAFKGGYTNNASFFTGVAVDELYLIRAEAYARLNNTTAALIDLNTLLESRWKTGTFNSVTALDANEVLNKILLERRKELLFRDSRWSDIKRLNKLQAGITLKRILNNQTYVLTPGSPAFAIPIPQKVIDMTGMPQNPH